MGIFDAITGAVIMDYKVKTDEAKAKIKELSGEQKKAAKEAAEALEKQGKAAESMASQYAKGTAIIVGGFLAARDGLQHMREEQRLVAGAAGVSIDALSESWDGLKTRMDLLTLAQAGHRGAWKLTTGQIQLVSEGMRALESKGYDTEKVFGRFTEVMKKGKLEGLDEFGLSLQATGDQTKDLQVLMNALGREVADVGGNFDKTGDSAQRSIVKMENGLSRLRSAAGLAAEKFLDLGTAIGNSLGQLVYGDLAEATGTAGRASKYAQGFQSLRGPQANVNPSFETGFGMFTSATNGADDQAGRMLSNFAGNVRKSLDGKGPLATASPEEFAAMIAGLPKDWDLVDKNLAVSVELMKNRLQTRFAIVGAEAGASVLTGFKNALSKNRDSVAKSGGRGRGGGGAKTSTDEWWLDGLIDTGAQFAGYLGDTATANMNAAERRRREDEIAQQRFEASMEQNRRFAVDLAGIEADNAAGERQSFLERTFGPVEEFDKYAAAFGTLKDAVTAGFSAWISGAESVGTAVRRAISQSLGGYAIEMAGMALVAGAHGIYHLTNPLTAAQGAGELYSAAKYAAAAVALGGLAKLASPSGGGSTPGGASSSTGSRGGRYQDHRGGGPGNWQPGGSNIVVVPVGTYDDESRRYRERQVYSAITRVQASYRPAEGTS